MDTAALYELVFNSSPTGGYLLSPTPDATILAVNDVFLETSSRKREELVGLSLFAAFPANPEDQNDTGVPALRNSILRVLATGKPDELPRQRYPIWVTGPDGEKRYEERFWSAVNVPIFSEDRELVCIAHYTTDVTANILAEAASQKSQERYRNLLDSIDQGFCIIEMLYDRDGRPRDYRFLEVNPMFEAQTGLTDAVGKCMRQFAPQHEQHWFDIYGRVAQTGEPIRFENEARQLNRWYDVYAFRIDEAGENKVAVLFKDIKDKRLAEESLRTSERLAKDAARQAEAERRRLDAVLEAVPVGIMVFDSKDGIQIANREFRRLWGEMHPAVQNIGEFREWRSWWADGSSRHGERVQPHDWTTARILRGEDASADIIGIESFQTPPICRITLVSGAPILDSQGEIVGAVVAQLDITDRMKAEEALRQAGRRKDEFLAMLAHELRNPLAPIAAAADLLAMGRLSEPHVKQTSEIIARQVRHMTGLVDDLLDVSRVTRGLILLSKNRLDAKRIVAEAVEQVRPLIEARRHRLAVYTPPESAFVLGDQKRLVQVMSNLLNNAAKYTPEGGDIVLSVEVEGDFVKMAVADNGIGMAPELVERAFELFAQAERASDRTLGGLGIGLALVKSLMELHGGSITAQSAGIGKGSRFTVCIPHLEEVSDSGSERSAATDSAHAGALKVMIVDDNVDAAQMLAILVEALGHHVLVEHGSRKALERATQEKPDVFLLDIGLPEMDGNELAKRLRADPATADAMLIAVTGYGQESDKQNSHAAGFDYHLVKPIDTKGLAAILAEMGKNKAH